MMLANRKYADPTNVLKSLVDDYGNNILVGEQKDIGEFNLNLLERIEEGLGELQGKLNDADEYRADQDLDVSLNKIEDSPIQRQTSILEES
jgi:hypothetical protein